MFVFEVLVEWLLTSVVYGVFAERAARRRYEQAMRGEPVSLPGRLQISNRLVEPVDVKFHFQHGVLTAEKSMGHPGRYELQTSHSGIELNAPHHKKKPWKTEPAIVFESPSGTFSVYCRPQDLCLLTFALRPISDHDEIEER